MWPSVSDWRGLELEVTEKQSEDRKKLKGEQGEGRNLFCLYPGKGSQSRGARKWLTSVCPPAKRLPSSAWTEALCALGSPNMRHYGSQWRPKVSRGVWAHWTMFIHLKAGRASAASGRIFLLGETALSIWPLYFAWPETGERSVSDPQMRGFLCYGCIFEEPAKGWTSRGVQNTGCSDIHFHHFAMRVGSTWPNE